MNDDRELSIRLRAFEWLAAQADLRGDVMPFAVLQTGFSFEGERISLMSQRGIFKPRQLAEIPLSITTSAKNPYGDTFGADGLLRYRYYGTDPAHPENAGVRKAKETGKPLAYFHGLLPGRYLPVWPVFIAGDDPATLTFSVAVDDLAAWRGRLARSKSDVFVAESDAPRRAYITTAARHRLHQHAFRERVIRAYQRQCALCRLRHTELLDAAHIIPDHEPEGEPIVANGLSLCKLHHAAYDRLFLAVMPDYRVAVNHRILEEEDGPMLRHGLQELHGSRILVPRRADLKPDPERLALRFAAFEARAAG